MDIIVAETDPLPDQSSQTLTIQDTTPSNFSVIPDATRVLDFLEVGTDLDSNPTVTATDNCDNK